MPSILTKQKRKSATENRGSDYIASAKAGYKTLYIIDELSEKISNLVKKHETSFNNIVISIIEDFFKENEEQ